MVKVGRCQGELEKADARQGTVVKQPANYLFENNTLCLIIIVIIIYIILVVARGFVHVVPEVKVGHELHLLITCVFQISSKSV